MPCPAVVTLWGEARICRPKATLYKLYADPWRLWLPLWAHTATPAPVADRQPHRLRLDVRRDWLAERDAALVARLEAGTARRVLTPRPVLVVTTQAAPAQDLVSGVYAVLRDSRLTDAEAATVLGLTAKQVRLLGCGYMRVETEAELQRIEAALREELTRQARVAGLQTGE
ncbi:hypothetical protein Mx8p78 [Myxococcus phage Mx8]|uniref:p78 n=1 Tax=Myxococcus phage Mx8 TaxID=49964 RepID=Q94MP1_9CAUD|nr:hypothetical protein Mx8p78 [Myxococcus phage Mx8]AAK94413.1 p78 [Myxococcus phage Mx8]